MSLHIAANPGDIAETVLISGDPRRAKNIAETMLTGAECFNEIRGMYGYTGNFEGKSVSVMGTGIGMPSTAIYLNELIVDYSVRKIIRIGTCGCIQPGLTLGDVVVAMGASTDSNINRSTFNGIDFAPLADFSLLQSAQKTAGEMNIKTAVGNIFSTDLFYHPNDPQRWEILAAHNVLCVEMETAILYTLAARFNVSSLSLLTVSDNILTGEAASAQDREKSFTDMINIALKIA
ncbi:purine-nucleoside phosphorylase [Fulvivirgaceae bacterium BMA12]|uniref:Uridine phosphorylase n=1 Tax=Agaribacillus aureus TaxID=3051825 RepID=A0ABT8L0K9_9BACT|nr:purine-nucleoside phosphorylase [Fulvivirgaceae bacterium BMA12]